MSSLDRTSRDDERRDREIRRLRRQMAQIQNGGRVRASSLAGTLGGSSGGSGTTGSPLGVSLWANASGAQRDQGYVVVSVPGTDQSFDDTTTVGDLKVIGVLDDNAVAVGVKARVRHIGYQPVVNVQGNVTAGHYLRTSTTSGRAEDAGTAPVVGAFGMALTAYSGGAAGQVAAFVFPPISATVAFNHVVPAQVDVTVASTTVPYQVVGPMPAAGTFTGVEAVAGEDKTNGAVSSIFDVHLIPAANVNTDGQGTTIFTTQGNRPTISNGNKKSTTTMPDVTAFGAGDYLAFYVDQQGTTLTVATIGVKCTFP